MRGLELAKVASLEERLFGHQPCRISQRGSPVVIDEVVGDSCVVRSPSRVLLAVHIVLEGLLHRQARSRNICFSATEMQDHGGKQYLAR
jgi:hypothetical protein